MTSSNETLTFPQSGRTALLNAAYKGHFATVEYLLETQGASCCRDRDGMDILMLGSNSGSFELVKYLISNRENYHLDINAQDSVSRLHNVKLTLI